MDDVNQEAFRGYPMSGQEFAWRQAEQMQRLELSDRNELVETARHHRTMERDTHRSMLRQQEYDSRQQWKLKTAEFLECEQGVMILVSNGKGDTVKKELLLERV